MLEKEQDKKKYEIPEQVLYDIITKALTIDVDTNNNGGDYHKYLSQSWVHNFAVGLQSYYRRNGCNVISFHNQRIIEDENEPPVKEFLYDITIAEYDSFYSSSKDKLIPFITKPIWQIESEFAEDMRETAKDFQKLISGNAPYKMMVTPLGIDDSKHYLTDMANLAQLVNGRLYLLSISHPSNWSEKIEWQLYKWGYWQLLNKVEVKQD